MTHAHPRSAIIHKRAISPVRVADNTAQVSQIIDTKGFEYIEFVTTIGAVADADATFTALVEDGSASNLSDAVAVSDDFLEGTEAQASFQFDSDNQIRRIGYRCRKRYVRYTVTPANNTGNADFAVIANLYGAKYQPITQPTS